MRRARTSLAQNQKGQQFGIGQAELGTDKTGASQCAKEQWIKHRQCFTSLGCCGWKHVPSIEMPTVVWLYASVDAQTLLKSKEYISLALTSPSALTN